MISDLLYSVMLCFSELMIWWCHLF